MTPPRGFDDLQMAGQMAGPLALGVETLDRAAEHRSDDAWLVRAWADPTTRVLLVDDGLVAVEEHDGDRTEQVERADRADRSEHAEHADHPTHLDNHASASATLVWSVAADVDRDAERYLLGVDESGHARFAVSAPLPAGSTGRGLRELLAVLADDEAGAVAHAVGLANWHAAHPRCARCGAATVVTDAGHVRRCSDDGSSHFPRTDPAIIVLVTDDEGRGLLARHPAWPANRFSTLAGFVEPGESLEQALRREVHEEVGVRVGETRYVGSQPWPFPSSLMCGYYAHATSTALAVDGVEITEAQWLSRSDLDREVAAGRLHFPSSASIARRLIEGWYGGPLPTGPAASSR